MLSMTYIRNNTDIVRQAAVDKQLDPAIIDQLLEVDKKRRELQAKVDAVRQQSNDNAKEIKALVQAGKNPTKDLIVSGKKIKEELKEVEPKLKELEDEFYQLMLQVPNVPATDVPVGPDESGNQVVKQVGKTPKYDFKPKPHQELMENLGMLDTSRAVRIAGFRSYFLKNDGLLLEQALLKYALDMLIKEGFEAMSAPVLVNEETMWGTGYFPWGAEDHYKTQDDQYLAGTAEVALTAYLKDETLKEKELPIKMVGISPCFRREVGSYGKDTQGVIRVHQFNKVEQVVYTIANEKETREWHERMTGYAEKLLENLKLPYQRVLMCTGDMGAGQRKKYDLETWFPAQDKYRETHSASYFNSFQSRRLNIRYQAQEGTIKYVYTLNNTMAASPRLLAAIVENYQRKDGSVEVPKVLQKYMGKKVID
jgi:seryl-tRNA synthetase